MSVVVEPTEPMAAELEKRPTTARSTMLKSICKRLVNIRGSEKPMIWRPRLPCVISSVAERAIKYPSLSFSIQSPILIAHFFPLCKREGCGAQKITENSGNFFKKAANCAQKRLHSAALCDSMLVLWMQETQSGPFGPLFLLQISEKTRIARDTMKKVTETVRELALPVVEENGCKLWDVEYVREAGQWYLRIYIDKDGGVNILDCEAISRALSDILDEADPIESSYIFEVASAGAERPLKRPGDFEQFMGSPVLLKTYKPVDGRKEFSGDLAGYDNGAVTLRIGEEEKRFEKDAVALVRLRCDF